MMSKISDIDKDNIVWEAKNWLNVSQYSIIKNISDEEVISHYEIRALVFSVLISCDDAIRAAVKKSYGIGAYYQLITSGDILKLSKNELMEILKSLRRLTKYSDRFDNRSWSLNTIEALTWSDVAELSKASDRVYKEIKEQYPDRRLIYPWHLFSPVDGQLEDGRLRISIKLECDKDQILSDITTLIDEAKNYFSEGAFKDDKQSDFHKLKDHQLLALCDFLIWCCEQEYPIPDWKIINEVVFNNTFEKDSAIKQRYKPTAIRLLNPIHVFNLRSKYLPYE